MSDRDGRQAIGVFDSGIGGLSILKALQAELPAEDFIYIADSGHAPYGERDESHVLARSRAITQHLVRQNVKAIVIACNTATAAAIEPLRAEYPALPIIGVEPALKPATQISRTRRIGVMATRRTLSSARFQALLAAQADQAEFVLQACDGLADAIEHSTSTGLAIETIACCARHIRVMGPFGLNHQEIDTLVLGCTHYPFASDALRTLIGPDVTLIDTGAPVARQTRARLAAASRLQPYDTTLGKLQLWSTGDAGLLQTAASRWLAQGVMAKTLNLL